MWEIAFCSCRDGGDLHPQRLLRNTGRAKPSATIFLLSQKEKQNGDRKQDAFQAKREPSKGPLPHLGLSFLKAY